MTQTSKASQLSKYKMLLLSSSLCEISPEKDIPVTSGGLEHLGPLLVGAN